MCGIAGVYNYGSGEPVAEARLRAMADAIKHRGPDGEGYYIDPKGNLGLAHRRLSIIDLSAAGNQPMSNTDQSLWITYNAEVYNYLELRTGLQAAGHSFSSHTDTEVVLHLYQKHGSACLERLNGMFAFAIWDERKRQLFLARDRFGVKPMYYYDDGEVFAFASEIKALLTHPRIKARTGLNPDALLDYINFQYCIGDKTFFRNIKRLEPGHYLLVDEASGRVTVQQWWDLDYSDARVDHNHDEDYFAEKLLMILEDAVRIELRSDVPVGAHLSGGVDSSTVASLAANLLGTPISTFSGGFRDGKEFDETPYARLVAAQIGADHHETFPTATDFAATLPHLIYHMDEPAAGPGLFPQYFVSKLAAARVKVVLGGQGGDELGGGYARYLVALLERALSGAINFSDMSQDDPFSLPALTPYLGQLRGYQPMLQGFWQEGMFGPPAERYLRLTQRSRAESLLTDEYIADNRLELNAPREAFLAIFNRPQTDSYLNRMLYYDAKAMLPALLHVEDRTSMAVSLESRVPLLDHRIAELFAAIPPGLKMKSGQLKYIYRKAIKNVIPTEVWQRSDKMGFPVPTNQWFRGPLQGFVQDVLGSDRARQRGIIRPAALAAVSSGSGSGQYGRELWGLLCLELWFERFVD
jgi:asparagine synthase (glutamine-hydrolysing)